MIKVPTVLVLGAGASMPYGFPSGIDLLDLICREAAGSFMPDLNPNGDTEIRLSIELFSEALRKSGRTSVDAFLEHRTDMIELGKKVIARALIPYEVERHLYHSDRQIAWYHYLYGAMNSDFENFGSNRISFVTYNYDRSLEHFLSNALRNSYGKSAAEAATVLERIPILHLHGSLCAYDPEQQGFGRPYLPNIAAETVTSAAKCIRIIHEDISQDEIFKRAIRLLQQAKRIAFIGFGYNETNVKRLNPASWCSAEKGVIGTTHGLRAAEENAAMAFFNGHMAARRVDALTLLRETFPLV